MSSPVTFLSLPNELVAKILETSNPPTSTLVGLAKTCTRLYAICLSLCLKAQGQIQPAESSSVSLSGARPATPTVDVLGALILATFITRIKQFRCALGKGTLDRMLRNLNRVARFVDRLDNVQEIQLDFDPVDTQYPILRDDDIYAWSNAIGKLLNTILRKGCRILEVNGLNQMTDIYHPVLLMPRPPSSSLLSTLKGLGLFKTAESKPASPETVLSGPSWRFDRSRFQSRSQVQNHILTHLTPEAKASSQLSHLTIESRSLLCPPLLQWTCSVLASSPISTLTIRNINFFGPIWSVLAILLPQSIPGLKRLELSNIGSFSHDQITALMDAFPDLEYLSADGLGLPWYTGLTSHTMQQIHFPKFRSLRELRIQEHWILPSFQDAFSVEALPALRILTVVFYDGEGWRRWEDSRSPVRVLFTEFSNRGPNLSFDVNMDILANTDVTAWMRMQRSLAGPSEEGSWLQCVSGVMLLFKGKIEFDHELKARSIVEKWFEQFPGLRRVAINTKGKDDGEGQSAENFCASTLRELFKTLDSVEVNGARWTA